ncbi:hypothetical protein [Streptomyces sp. NPDC003710]
MLFLDDEEHDNQLHRCLTDASLPLELRIVGALIRLYGLPLIRIVHLTTDRFHQDERGAHFTLDKNPVLLPPTLARLIEQQITTGRSRAALGPLATSEHPELLLPGQPASRPRSPETLSGQLMRHGLPTIAARNTAPSGMAGELPPIINSDSSAPPKHRDPVGGARPGQLGRLRRGPEQRSCWQVRITKPISEPPRALGAPS